MPRGSGVSRGFGGAPEPSAPSGRTRRDPPVGEGGSGSTACRNAGENPERIFFLPPFLVRNPVDVYFCSFGVGFF